MSLPAPTTPTQLLPPSRRPGPSETLALLGEALPVLEDDGAAAPVWRRDPERGPRHWPALLAAARSGALPWRHPLGQRLLAIARPRSASSGSRHAEAVWCPSALALDLVLVSPAPPPRTSDALYEDWLLAPAGQIALALTPWAPPAWWDAMVERRRLDGSPRPAHRHPEAVDWIAATYFGDTPWSARVDAVLAPGHDSLQDAPPLPPIATRPPGSTLVAPLASGFGDVPRWAAQRAAQHALAVALDAWARHLGTAAASLRAFTLLAPRDPVRAAGLLTPEWLDAGVHLPTAPQLAPLLACGNGAVRERGLLALRAALPVAPTPASDTAP